MNKKGQIVEILSSSSFFNDGIKLNWSNEQDFLSNSQKRRFSLFDGILVGEHQGLGDFKLGQRKGINLGGKKKPLYVIGIDEAENRLFVGEGADHPGLFIKVLAIDKKELKNNEGSLPIIQNDLVEVKPEFEEKKISAKLWISENYLFFQLENPVRIDVVNHQIFIYHRNEIVFNLNLK